MIHSILQDPVIRSVYESSPDAILIVDENLRVVFHNHQFGEIWKIPSKSLKGFQSNSAVGIDYKPILALLRERVKHKEEYINKVKWLYENPQIDDVSEIELLDHRILERYSSGVFKEEVAIGRIWFFRDISIHKKIEKQLESHNLNLETLVKRRTQAVIRAKEIAEDATKVKSHFLSSMSNELRTPLNAIVGFSQLLVNDLNDPLTEDQKDSVNYILSSGEYLISLVNQLLELSHIESSSASLSIESVTINKVIEESVSFVNSMAETRHIQVNIVSEEKLLVIADHAKLKQVILNLLNNALKYSLEDENVTINCYETGENKVRVDISYMENAISDENKNNLLTILGEHSSENSDIQGIGIGLVVSKKLIELMDGHIGYDYQEYKGMTFWFELPISI